MVILLSPTKTFTKNNIQTKNKPFFINEANTLIKEIEEWDVPNFEKEFKISNKLAITTKDYFANITNTNMAVYTYGGTAFKYLDPLNLEQDKLSRIYIMSGLYGILNALDGISPYRLDITNTTFTNLYNYWKEPVTNYLLNLNKPILNLASNEYTKHLDLNKLNIITVDFIEYKNGKPTSQSMMLKKMRGLMANYIIDKNINNFDIIKEITIDDFFYNEELSNKQKFVFCKG